MTTANSLEPKITSNVAVADARRVEAAARGIGLKPVRAWVPTERKAGSKEAERVRRHREKAEREGNKQISVLLPTELHPMLRSLATRTKAGEPASSVLTDLISELQGPVSRPNVVRRQSAMVVAWKKLSVWSRRLLWRVLPSSFRTWLK